MKSKNIRVTAVILLLCIVLSGAFAGKGAAAAPAENRVVDIPFGADISGYDPDTDGDVPGPSRSVRRGPGGRWAENNGGSAYMPVLVSDGHLYIADSEIQSVLGLTWRRPLMRSPTSGSVLEELEGVRRLMISMQWRAFALPTHDLQ